MTKCVAWFRRIDRLCARLNAGLMAVTVALSIVLAVQLTVRASILLDDAQQQLAVHGDLTALSVVAD